MRKGVELLLRTLYFEDENVYVPISGSVRRLVKLLMNSYGSRHLSRLLGMKSSRYAREVVNGRVDSIRISRLKKLNELVKRLTEPKEVL